MEIALYLAALGFKGIWFSPGKEQTEQPKEYMRDIVEASYLKYMLADQQITKVRFTTGGKLKIINLSPKNARSPRADFVIYDEEAQAEREAYDAAVSILTVTQLGLVFHISTPTKASIFEENYDRLLKRQHETGLNLLFSRTWQDVSYLERKRRWYMEEKASKPPWYFRQEHEASFELPSGAVFHNVIYEPYSAELQKRIKDSHNCSGVDWNPAAGHTRATIKWTPDLLNIVVVGTAIFSSGYAREMKEKEFYQLAPWFTNGNALIMEDGGINIPYIDWFNDMIEHFRFNWREQRWGTEEWDTSGLNKMQTINYLLQHGVTIYVDKIRFPKLAKQIEDCAWDEDALGEPKIKKDSANSPHFLDAFLHAISEKNRDDYRYEVANW